MGAFLLFREKNINEKEIEKLYASSIDIFQRKKLPLKQKFVYNDFILYVFGKKKIDVDNVISINNKSFIVGTGTYIYEGKKGKDALKKLYFDFLDTPDCLKNIIGNYAIIIKQNDRLYLFNDYQGLYRIFSDSLNKIFSSSILPITELCSTLTISSQEFYEYIFTGAFYGDATVFNEVKLLNSRIILEVISLEKIQKFDQFNFEINTKNSLEICLEDAEKELLDYGSSISKAFANEVIVPITGGYDSRLVYAALKKSGINPKYGFVLKKDHQKDVEIASQISEHEGFTLRVLPNEFPNYKNDESLNILKDQYYLYDGLGIGGVFQYFSGLDVWKQLEYTDLLMDGGGGEIYRNMHKLPTKRMRIVNYIKQVLNKRDLNFAIDSFSEDQYFKNIESKIKSTIKVNSQLMTREESERVFSMFYLKYWMGTINSAANQFSYYLTPFSDEKIVLQSLSIPVKYKTHYDFEAKLIRRIDTEVAKFPSNYGFNFYDERTVKSKILEGVKVMLSPQIKQFVKTKILKKKPQSNRPFYAQNNYVKESLKLDQFVQKILSKNQLEVMKYVDFSKAVNPDVVSRALSVELVISKKF